MKKLPFFSIKRLKYNQYNTFLKATFCLYSGAESVISRNISSQVYYMDKLQFVVKRLK